MELLESAWQAVPFGKKRGIIRCSSFKKQTKIRLFLFLHWCTGEDGLKMVCRPHISTPVASTTDSSGCPSYIHNHVSPVSYWFTVILKRYFICFHSSMLKWQSFVCRLYVWKVLYACVFFCMCVFGCADFVIRPYPLSLHTFVATVCR